MGLTSTRLLPPLGEPGVAARRRAALEAKRSAFVAAAIALAWTRDDVPEVRAARRALVHLQLAGPEALAEAEEVLVDAKTGRIPGPMALLEHARRKKDRALLEVLARQCSIRAPLVAAQAAAELGDVALLRTAIERLAPRCRGRRELEAELRNLEAKGAPEAPRAPEGP